MSSQANAKISPTGGHATAALVAKAAAGDRDAFATLYNEHRPQVYAYFVYRTRDRVLAEDLTQDVFLRAFRRLDTFSGPVRGGFPAWLATIARNIYVDHCKAARTRREALTAELLDFDAPTASAEESALCRMQQTETVDGLIKALSKLTPAQRQVIGFRFIEGLAIDETGRRMGKNHGAVKTLTFRALTSIRCALTEAQGVAA